MGVTVTYRSGHGQDAEDDYWDAVGWRYEGDVVEVVRGQAEIVAAYHKSAFVRAVYYEHGSEAE